MREIDLNEAKTHPARVFDTALGGEDVVITKDDQPVLKLVSIRPANTRRKAGSARGLVTIAPDFDDPLDDFEEHLR